MEECKYEIKNNKMENFINDDLDPTSSDESDKESENKSDNESEKKRDLMTNLPKVKTVF